MQTLISEKEKNEKKEKIKIENEFAQDVRILCKLLDVKVLLFACNLLNRACVYARVYVYMRV